SAINSVASTAGTARRPRIAIVPPAASSRTGRLSCESASSTVAATLAGFRHDLLTWRSVSTAANPLTDPELLETEWDLDPLVDGEGADGADRFLDDAVARASAFNESYAGQVASLDGAALRTAMGELAEIEELVGRAGSYASLQFSTDTADPERGALL